MSLQARSLLFFILVAFFCNHTKADDKKPLNVLFIAADDLRPSIGAYGDPLAITPHLDRLAESGTLFLQAYCQQAVCSPSRTSLLTGTRPDTTGIYDLKTHFRDRLPEIVTLPQLFRQHGYQVVGRGKIYHGTLDDARSWDSPPKEGRSTKGTLYALRENNPEHETRLPAFERADVPDNAYADGILAEQAVAELRELKKQGKPFFYALGVAKPHLPFNAPEKYWALHDPEKLWPPPTRTMPLGVPDWVGQPGWELRNRYDVPSDTSIPLDEDLQKNLRHGYYAATSFVDAQIGKVLDSLKAEGLEENTIVVLWGDHGYHAGEHGLWCKHTNFEEAVRTALVLRAPGFPAGHRVRTPVELLDVYPTLAALCGLPIPSTVEGKSLIPLLEEEKAPDPNAVAFSQYPRGGPATGNPMMGYSVRKGPWRYTEWLRTDTGKVEFAELYHLETDPNVTENRAAQPEYRETVAELSTLLEKAGSGVAKARELAR